MTNTSGSGKKGKEDVTLAFPRQTLSKDIDPLPAGNLLSGRLGGGI